MRLDKYLKVSRIIKRRTVAKEACDGKRVSINGKIAKAGSEINEGDVIEITFKEKGIKARVLKISEHVKKEEAARMYEILEGEEDTDEEE
jgi:ribosomal 50S subunit-recycling heat shock protein